MTWRALSAWPKLKVLRGSHRSAAFAKVRTTYGRTEVGGDGTRSGWLTDNAALLPAVLANGGVASARTGAEAGLRGVTAGSGGHTTGVGDGTTGAGDVRTGLSPGLDWRTADFQPGDVAILTIDTVHMSAANCSGDAVAETEAGTAAGGGAGGGAARVRVSCDTRWQLGSELSDPRLKVWRRRGASASAAGRRIVDELRLDGWRDDDDNDDESDESDDDGAHQGAGADE
jgi:hypothetical protein